MQAVLVMFRNDGERRSFSISREMTVIGRRQDCDLMIPLGEISRKHCRIIRDDDTLRIEDLGSSNGTFHNGRRIQEAVLSAGDTIQVGPVAFVIQIDGVPEDDEIKPNLAATAGAAGAGAMLDDDEDALEALPDDDDLEATPGHELDTNEDALEEEESEAMEQPVIRKGGRAGAAADDDDLEVAEPSDADLEEVEAEQVSADDEDLAPLELDDDAKADDADLEPIGLEDSDDDKPAKSTGGKTDEDDLLDVLSGDDDEDLADIDTAALLEEDEDADVDEKPKRRK